MPRTTKAEVKCPLCGEALRVEVYPGSNGTRLDPPEGPEIWVAEGTCEHATAYAAGTLEPADSVEDFEESIFTQLDEREEAARQHQADLAMERWARDYNDSEGHPVFGGPEDR